jgi:hypothetical protein
MIHPIIDKYYSYDPSHSRSAQYATEKGFVSTSPGASAQRNVGISPGCMPQRLDSSMVAERLRDVQRTARGQVQPVVSHDNSRNDVW